MPSPDPVRRRLLLAMAAVAAVAFLAAAPGAWVRASHGAAASGDEPHYLLTAISLAEDADLDVSDEHAEQRYRPFHEADLNPQAGTRPDGSQVAPHDPLLPALLAGPWALGGWRGAKLALAAVAAGLAALTVWTAVRRFGAPLGPATAVVGLAAASVPLAPYGTQVYPELPAALAVVAVVAALPGLPRRGPLAAALLALVALPWLAVKYVPTAAVLAGLVLWRLWQHGKPRRVAATVGLLALAGGLYLAAHQVWYGGLTVYAAGDFFREHGGQLSVVGTEPQYLGRARRLVGLLIGRHFGLAAWQPAWLLAVPALAALVARRPRGWHHLALPLAAGWLVATFVALTMQGWWMPGRQVVHVLPLAVIALAWWVGRVRWRLAAAVGLGLLGIWSYGWLLGAGLAGDLTWIVDFTSTPDPWYRLWRHALPDYLDVTASTWVLQTLWLAGLVAAGLAAASTRIVARRTAPQPDPPKEQPT